MKKIDRTVGHRYKHNKLGTVLEIINCREVKCVEVTRRSSFELGEIWGYGDWDLDLWELMPDKSRNATSLYNKLCSK